MASSNIKLFDENKGNMLSDSEFSISNQRMNGLQTGVASSQLQNKAMYQASLIAYAIAQIMMQNGKNANDTDAVSAFVANLSGTMLQKVYDLATTAEAQAGVATGKWMSPALVKAAIDTLAAKSQNILSDTTKALYGLDSSAVPDDVFRVIPKTIEPVGTVKTTLRSDLTNDWLLANGETFDADQYPELLDLIPADITKEWPIIEIPKTPFPSPVDGTYTTTLTTYSGSYKIASKVYGEYLYILFRVSYDTRVYTYLTRIKKDFSGEFEISNPISYYSTSSGAGFYGLDFAIDETTGKTIVVGFQQYGDFYGFAWAYADSFDGVWTASHKSDACSSTLFPQIEFVNGIAFCAIGSWSTTTESKAFRYAYSINYGKTWTYTTITKPYSYFNGMVIKKVSNDKVLLFYASASTSSTSYSTSGNSSYNWGFVIAEFNASNKSLTTLKTVAKTNVYGSYPNLGLIQFRGNIICSYYAGSFSYNPETGELRALSNAALKNLVGTASWYDANIDKHWVIAAPVKLCVLDNVNAASTNITDARTIREEDGSSASKGLSLDDYPKMVFNDNKTFIFWPRRNASATGNYLYGNYSPFFLPTITVDNAYCYIKGR